MLSGVIVMSKQKISMINKNYSPDTAHMPSAEDMKKWRGGGRQKEINKQKALQRFVEHYNKLRK